MQVDMLFLLFFNIYYFFFIAFFFFFFSSRRRHTRYWRDWSSDVCSSDLVEVLAARHGRVLTLVLLADLAAQNFISERASDRLPFDLVRRGRRGRDRHALDRKSTRLNSSHANISYAVFCLKKKRKTLQSID